MTGTRLACTSPFAQHVSTWRHNMRRSVSILVPFATALALVSLPALARQDRGDRLGEADKQFLRDALQGVMIQADISRLARERSDNEHVRRFAEEKIGRASCREGG